MLYPAELLIRQTEAVLRAWGMAEPLVATSSRMIVEADLRGIDSHGVSMLPYYAGLLRAGGLDLAGQPRVVRERATSALIDAGAGLGHAAGVMAMEMAVAKARENDIAIVSVFNSHHFGAAGPYAEMAAQAGLIGIVSTTARVPAVLPTFGLDRVLGTNPFAFAAPSGQGHPVLLDMSTSVVAANKVKAYAFAGKPLPPAWVLDEAGADIADAAEGERIIFRDRVGGLLPLGGAGMLHGGHKGFGLGLFAQILAGTLGGGAFAPLRDRTPGSPDNIGHVFLAIDPRAFRPDGAFEEDIDAMVAHIRSGHRADPDQPILVAGDPEWAAREARLRDGVPLEPSLVEALRVVAEGAGVAFLL
jgi:LDH2 family malate/lactate/ureidoglycolate dehydrogenase